jgi:hypothetical protein
LFKSLVAFVLKTKREWENCLMTNCLPSSSCIVRAIKMCNDGMSGTYITEGRNKHT